jgi:hypothetical protein
MRDAARRDGESVGHLDEGHMVAVDLETDL